MMPETTRNSTRRSRSSRAGKRVSRRPPRAYRAKRPSRRQISAGGIIYRKRAGRIEIFFIKDPFGRWTFPKGKQELGETLAQTAVREIQEETGLRGLRLIAPLGRTNFRFVREESVIEKTVYLFLFEAPSSAKATLTGEGEIWQGAWMGAHQAFSISGYRNLDRILAKAMRVINERCTS